MRTVKPGYTAAAMDAHIEGTVAARGRRPRRWQGRRGDGHESLDKEYGLDTQAVEAARQWLFKPGTKDGKPVAVRVTLEMTFTLK